MVVSVSLLPQEYEMEYLTYCITVNLHYIMITMDKSIANGDHLLHNGKQITISVDRKLCKSMYQVIKIHVHA